VAMTRLRREMADLSGPLPRGRFPGGCGRLFTHAMSSFAGSCRRLGGIVLLNLLVTKFSNIFVAKLQKLGFHIGTELIITKNTVYIGIILFQLIEKKVYRQKI